MIRKFDSISPWEYVLYPLMIVLFFALFTFPVFEGDFFWHLNTGKWIWNNKSLPQIDPFTFTADPATLPAGSHRIRMILSQYWLGQLLFYAIWSTAGFKGIILTRAFVYSAVLVIIGVWTRKIAQGVVPFFFLFIVGSQLLHHSNERPQLFAFLLMPIVLYLLENMRKARDSAKSHCWLLPILMLVWANIHGSFILGAVIIVLFAMGHLFCSWRDGTHIRTGYVLCLLGSAMITTINPNGFWTLIEILRVSSETTKNTQEFQSPLTSLLRYRKFDPYWFLLIPTLALLLFRCKKMAVEHVLLLTALALLSLSGGRYIPFFMFTLPVVSIYLPSISLPKRYESILPLLVLLLFLQFNFKSIFKFRESSNFPREAITFISAVRPEGRIFNHSDWGGYISYFAPDHQIFLDGRILVEDCQKQQIEAMNGIGWKELFDRYRISIAILPSHSLNRNTFTYGKPLPLVFALLQDRSWVPVYANPLSIVFIRNMPVHAGIINLYRLDSGQLLRRISAETL